MTYKFPATITKQGNSNYILVPMKIAKELTSKKFDVSIEEIKEADSDATNNYNSGE